MKNFFCLAVISLIASSQNVEGHRLHSHGIFSKLVAEQEAAMKADSEIRDARERKRIQLIEAEKEHEALVQQEEKEESERKAKEAEEMEKRMEEQKRID